MTRRFHRWSVSAAGAILMMLLAGGCPGINWPNWPNNRNNTPPEPTDGKSTLQRFASEDELLAYFRARLSSGSDYGLWRGADLMAGAPTGAAPTSAEDSAGGTDGAQAGAFSTTNVQEEGVDESDVLKTDGTHFYIAKGKTLRIVRAVPRDAMAEVAQLGLADTESNSSLDRVDSLYLNGSHLIVLAAGSQYAPWLDGSQIAPGTPEPMVYDIYPYYVSAYLPTVVVVDVDISDPTQPVIVGRATFEGALNSSRLTNGRLIFVLSLDVSRLAYFAQSEPEDLSLPQALPTMVTRTAEFPVVAPGDWFRSTLPNSYGVTAVVTLPADNIETVAGSVAVMTSANTVYASTEAVYLAEATYSYSTATGYRETTSIHKLAFNDQAVAEYVASGVVPGYLLNQFSLGEYEGYLRVATHIGAFWAPGAELAVDVSTGGGVAVAVDAAEAADEPKSSQAQELDAPVSSVDSTAPADVDVWPASGDRSNAVYVLGQDGAELRVVGKIVGIAPGERLYSARFQGNHGFLVTFKQIDPLFVLDLSDPTNPRQVGKLKVPGYSDYLHPIGDHLLLGIGRSTYDTPWGGTVPAALQVSLFNVSDWTDPTIIGEPLVLGGLGSSSEVSYNPKAFAIRLQDGLLGIPAMLTGAAAGGREPWGGYSGHEFDGIVCVRIDETAGLSEVGRVASVVYEDYGWTEWRRPVFIGDDLYAVTAAGIRAAPTSSLDATSTLVLVPAVDESGYGHKGTAPSGGAGL